MATFVKLPGFFEHLGTGVHDLGSDTIRLALSNTAPGSESPDPTDDTTASQCVLANVTEISYTNLSSRTVTTTSAQLDTGIFETILEDLLLTASGGSVGPFRYVYVYNDTPTSPADPLIGYIDYGSSITLLDTETLNVDMNQVNGAIRIA